MSEPLPHEQVYVRLGISGIHGIGVFAIRDIGKDTNLFANDRVELVWIECAELDRAGLSDEQRRLYRDFSINRGNRIGCPINFNNLTPGWFLNEPPEGQKASVRVDRELNFFAARDISAGEELSVTYSDFSKPVSRPSQGS